MPVPSRRPARRAAGALPAAALAAAALAAVVLVLPEDPAAGACGGLRKRPRIGVDPVIEEARTVTDLPARRLDRMKDGGGSSGADAARGPGPARPGIVLGLTTTPLAYDIRLRIRVRRTAGGACGTVRNVHANLRLDDPVVRIAREVPRGTCAFRSVMDHERRHLRAAGRAVREGARMMRARLRRALRRNARVHGPGPEAVERKLRRIVERAARRTLEDVDAHLEKRHAAIDTPAEYRRRSRSCGGAVGRITERVLGM